jgi:hypothetical protein
VQEPSQVLLKAPVVMEVHAGCYEIWLFECSNSGAAETSAGELVPHSDSSGTWHYTTTRHFIYHIRLWYCHNICYIILWHVFS